MAGVENRLLCNCCFDEYPLAQMAQCTEAHLICVGCFTRHVEMHLGMDNTTRIICISSVSVRCEAPYHESEVRRLLPESVGLYERIRQREDIERSGLGMLEECPRCSYASIVKNDASLIRCKNRACRLVSCRECKKVDHSPRSCAAEAEREHRNGRHAVEEAMTAALVRKCPNCRRPFTKESGCNKMKCPNCWTVSCYVCRQVLTGADPYTHFTNVYNSREGCPLYDNVEQRHAREVAKAGEQAIARYSAQHPELELAQQLHAREVAAARKRVMPPYPMERPNLALLEGPERPLPTHRINQWMNPATLGMQLIVDALDHGLVLKAFVYALLMVLLTLVLVPIMALLALVLAILFFLGLMVVLIDVCTILHTFCKIMLGIAIVMESVDFSACVQNNDVVMPGLWEHERDDE